MLARVFEAAGLATVGISLVRVHTEKVRPPRYLFVPFPFGRPLGKPNDSAFQQSVIDAALALLKRPESDKPILEDFPVILDEEPDNDEVLECALVVPPRRAKAQESQQWLEEVSAEIAQLRPFFEAGRQKTGRTMIGPSGIAPENIEQAAQYLVQYLKGETLSVPEGVRLVQYLRWCADDLKVFYQEAAVARQEGKDWTNRQLQDWLWHQTALGGLIIAVRAKINVVGDALDKAIAFGLAPRGYN